MKGNLPILIIEDKIPVQESIRRAMQHNKISNPVFFATTRTEAFDYLSSIHYLPTRSQNRLPGVILLNYKVEGDNSLQILTALKSDSIYQQVPVIVFSDEETEEDMDACYALGCNGYFKIPTTAAEYNNIIKVIYDFWLHAAAIPYFAEKV